MTKRKRWPNAAEWAREDSIALAMKTLDELMRAREKTQTPATLRSLMIAIDNQHKIIEQLKAVKGDQNV